MQSVAERMEKRIERIPFTTCWIWKGTCTPSGHGQINIKGKMKVVSRVAYELAKGQIPEGLTIDHLCQNPPCVNPAHLEAVSRRENTLRGNGPAARRARQTHCKNGHLLNKENIYTPPHRPRERNCRKCKRKLLQMWYKKKINH